MLTSDVNADSLNVFLDYTFQQTITVDSIISQKITRQGLKTLANESFTFSLVSQQFAITARPQLKSISNIYKIVFKKYCRYMSDDDETCRNTQLLDLLSSGCTLYGMIHSFENYEPSIEQEIKLITQLVPASIICNVGTLEGRVHVPPLVMACCNSKIPLKIIKLILDAGADPNQTYCLLDRTAHNGPIRIERTVTILDDFDFILPVEGIREDSERSKRVKQLLIERVKQLLIAHLTQSAYYD